MAWSAIFDQELAKRIFQSHLSMNRVPNAYLLVGLEGTGKRMLAVEMAKALNCQSKDARPCDACRVCGQVMRGTHPDVHLLLSGGASDQIKIDQIRAVIGRIGLRPFSAAFQVVIVDGAERLTEEAANSLLKSLEEPSVHTRFILTTARLEDCLPTVASRCQVIRCQPLSFEAVARVLAETQSASIEVARRIASLSGGSASRAIGLLQSWQAHEQRLLRFAQPSQASWGGASSAAQSRQEVAELLDAMMLWLRDVAMVSADAAAWIHNSDHTAALKRQSTTIDLDRCLDAADELVALRASIDQYVNPRLIASVAREKWFSLLERNKEPSVQRLA